MAQRAGKQAEQGTEAMPGVGTGARRETRLEEERDRRVFVQVIDTWALMYRGYMTSSICCSTAVLFPLI